MSCSKFIVMRFIFLNMSNLGGEESVMYVLLSIIVFVISLPPCGDIYNVVWRIELSSSSVKNNVSCTADDCVALLFIIQQTRQIGDEV